MFKNLQKRSVAFVNDIIYLKHKRNFGLVTRVRRIGARSGSPEIKINISKGTKKSTVFGAKPASYPTESFTTNKTMQYTYSVRVDETVIFFGSSAKKMFSYFSSKQ